MDIFNKQYALFAKLVSQLYDLPSPSKFGKPSGWSPVQKSILCLRPGSARGLPLCTLHDVFRKFQCENSVLLPNPMITVEPMPAEVLAAHIAASRLCHDMGDSFKNERKRSVAFDSCVVGLFEKWNKEHVLQPEKSRCFGKADQVILEDNVVIAIREGKWKAGHGGSDVYMQIARDYDLLVRVLVESTETAAINFLSHGAPCFLICVLGTYCCILIIALIVLSLPRTHVIRMWWILRRPQTHCRATFQRSVHAS